MVRSTDVIEVATGPEGGSTVTYEATLTLKGGFAVHPPHRPGFRRIGDRAAVGLRAALAA